MWDFALHNFSLTFNNSFPMISFATWVWSLSPAPVLRALIHVSKITLRWGSVESDEQVLNKELMVSETLLPDDMTEVTVLRTCKDSIAIDT